MWTLTRVCLKDAWCAWWTELVAESVAAGEPVTLSFVEFLCRDWIAEIEAVTS